MLDKPNWSSRPWHRAQFTSAPKVKVTKRGRADAAKRQRDRTLRKKMLALGYTEETIFVSPETRSAWEDRERVSDPNARLAVEHYAADLSDILAEWAEDWFRKKKSHHERDG